eukprot:gene6246-8976_t
MLNRLEDANVDGGLQVLKGEGGDGCTSTAKTEMY